MTPGSRFRGGSGVSAGPSNCTDRCTPGYLHRGYAESLSAVGRPRRLQRSGGWLLERGIPGTGHRDAMGCYPLFACGDWSQLPADIDADLGDLVSLTVVTDPFAPLDEAALLRCFDQVVPFKNHLVVDLAERTAQIASSHHRRRARTALKSLRVERVLEPVQFADTWIDLYANLVARHHITGISAFSGPSLVAQLAVPGLVAFRAHTGGETVAMTLWYVHDDVAYYHLGASSDTGYRLGASYAVFWDSLSHFAEIGLRRLSLGAGAGARATRDDGLTRFKRGWATSSLPVYLCGRVVDPERYRDITLNSGVEPSGYFPAYRAGEFA